MISHTHTHTNLFLWWSYDEEDDEIMKGRMIWRRERIEKIRSFINHHTKESYKATPYIDVATLNKLPNHLVTNCN
jgi:hypothetical protein